MNNTQSLIRDSKKIGVSMKPKDLIGRISNDCYVSENLNCFIFEVAIREAVWDFKENEVIEMPILAKTFKQAEKMYYALWGSEYPTKDLLSIRQIGNKPFYYLQIQDEFLRDFIEYGVKKTENKKKIKYDDYIKEQVIKEEINNDTDQPERAIANYLIRESQETKFTQKQFYQMVIDSAEHELNLINNSEETLTIL